MIAPATDETRLRLLVCRIDRNYALGIGTTMLDDLIASRSLPAIRIGRRVLIHADDVSSFANAARRDGSI